ncbi:GNAT family N-acetyltransferase [Actinopolymorpha cephalotaxi]|uniref:Ribosomal protein S18 acetylase RimI-like enzyme n=1 Tax=Actinopolymorpha cephalotaxi TaxID=504797 RepID=A0ABX2S115_9ACTN|nr:GNAT family N-acetyltransferase [Actinopolymorpha cephalotaxi]NYH82062.1 ribosomal protein S18 acetylase RimI-like enzyme [Actinopolymorpha cephalotaxi]
MTDVRCGSADPELAGFLADRINSFNVAKTGIVFGGSVTAAVRDDAGEVMAGVAGWVWGGTCWIESLWVREDRRGSGLGSRLLQVVTEEARTRSCTQIVLHTHSFQAPGFYRRHGFEVVGRADGYPAGHAFLLMRKDIAG